MVDPDALADVSDDVLRERTLSRPPSGLRDIQYLYGSLYTLATSGGGEYDPYLTPDYATDILGEDNSLIVVNVDLSGPSPSFDGVNVLTYTEDLIDAVAHSKYAAGRGMDHSITHQSSTNGNLPDQLAEYAVERLSRWPHDDLVQEAADDHPNGDLIHQLAVLGESETVRTDVYASAIHALGDAGLFGEPDPDAIRDLTSKLRTAEDADERDELVEDFIDAHEGAETVALITARIKTEPDGDYRWPGDFDVLQEAMKTRKLGKFRSKNEAENSAGLAVDYITGTDARVVGTPEDPLKYYLSMQTERFPDFDPDQSWRNQPLAEDAALRILKSEEFIDACLYSGVGDRNTRVYYLPYFTGEVTTRKLRVLYRILAELSETEDPEKPPLVQAYNASGEMRDQLRFYTIIAVFHHNERADVLGEGTSETTVYPVELANRHRDVLDSVYFGDSDETPFRRTESHPLLDAETNLFEVVATGRYFYYTYADYEDAGPANDPRVSGLYAAVSGTPLNVSTVLEEYVAAIDDHDMQEYGFPGRLIQAQFAQLCALAETGLLSASRDVERPFLEFDITAPQQLPMPDTNTTPPSDDDDAEADHSRDVVTDGGDDQPDAPDQLDVGDGEQVVETEAEETSRERRERRLGEFIENHPPIRDNHERQAVFLLGALVGHLSNYQKWNGKRRTLVDRHQITHLTKSNIKGVVSNVLEKNSTYASESGYGVQFYGEITSRMMDTLTTADPQDWEISVADLRYHYGLGITYGLEQAYRDRDGDDADGDADEAATADPTEEEAATPE